MKKNRGSIKLFLSQNMRHYVFVTIAVLILNSVVSVEAVAQGGLLISPRRVVFDGKQKTMQLNLANSGKDTSTYYISFIQYRMTEEGRFQRIEEPDSAQFFANKYLRLFPRSVTLLPGESQVVKIQLRGYNRLPDGEYRSHLYFKLENDVTALGEDKEVDSTAVSVRLIPIYGISIPAIIRKGKSTTQVNLSDLVVNMVNDTTPGLNITFNRTGNFSVYGDVTVYYISPDLEEPVQVGLVRGLAVYTPNKLRRFTLALDNNYNYNKGTLRIVYKSKSDLNKTVTLAEKELILGN